MADKLMGPKNYRTGHFENIGHQLFTHEPSPAAKLAWKNTRAAFPDNLVMAEFEWHNAEQLFYAGWHARKLAQMMGREPDLATEEKAAKLVERQPIPPDYGRGVAPFSEAHGSGVQVGMPAVRGTGQDDP